VTEDLAGLVVMIVMRNGTEVIEAGT
jgi:hypothetical protein